MIRYNKEYFENNCYFFLKDNGDKISLYYSVAENLTESRKKDVKKEFDKKDESKVKKIVHKFLTKKGKPTKNEIEKEIEKVESGGEIGELVDADGTMSTSKIPILQMPMHPKKTMDQTVTMARISNDPVTRGYRVYWGESEEKGENLVSEIDFSDAFGYEETKDKDYSASKKILKKMGVEDSEELEDRLKQLGKLKKQKVKRDKKDGKLMLKQRLTEKGSIEEEEKKRAIKMLEDILSKKKKDNSDVVNKKSEDSDVLGKIDDPKKKILMKNLMSIKNMAEKQGISLNQLIKALKTDE